MGGHNITLTVYKLVAQKIWQRKQTPTSGFALGIGSFIAIIPGHPVDNYYMYTVEQYLIQASQQWLSSVIQNFELSLIPTYKMTKCASNRYHALFPLAKWP